MSRLYRFMTVGLFWIFAMICHWFAVNLFGPTTATWTMIEPGATNLFIEDGWREGMYLVFAQYIPLLFMGGSLVWLFAKEWETTINTGVRR